MGDRSVPREKIGRHRLIAYHTAHDSEHKMHDDALAKRLGFAGGLGPVADLKP